MRRKTVFALWLTACLITAGATLSFSQEQTPPDSSLPSETETQWLWGEAISVDQAKNTLLVRYLDYDTEQEKEMLFCMDDKTAFENVKSASEIKPHDAISVDYVLTAGGLIIARKVSIEKPEAEAGQ